MADAPKDSDQSMEDILQSIKRIIADEGDAPPASAVGGSDVLELTELLAEDVAVDSPALSPGTAEMSSMSLDDIMAAPISSMPQTPITLPAAVPEPEPEPEPEPVIMAQPKPVIAAPAPTAMDDDKIMSDSTLAASVAALAGLSHRKDPALTSHDSPAFRSGTTVEDLVLESLKPMLKDWLDTNLPSMVRQLVEREIRRISGRS